MRVHVRAYDCVRAGVCACEGVHALIRVHACECMRAEMTATKKRIPRILENESSVVVGVIPGKID